MSLYNDLTDVLTPYANKIKEVNESLDDKVDKSNVASTITENSNNPVKGGTLYEELNIITRTINPASEVTYQIHSSMSGSGFAGVIITCDAPETVSYAPASISVAAKTGVTVKFGLFTFDGVSGGSGHFVLSKYLGSAVSVNGVATIEIVSDVTVTPGTNFLLAYTNGQNIGWAWTENTTRRFYNFTANDGVQFFNLNEGESTTSTYTFKVPPILDASERLVTGLYSITYTQNESSIVKTVTNVKEAVQGLLARQNEEVERHDNVLYGKKWAVCGDSITEGDTRAVDPNIDGGNTRLTYHYYIGTRNNMIVSNHGISGTTMMQCNPNDSSEKAPFCLTRMTQIPSDSDYITLWFGINDAVWALQYHNNDPNEVIGSITDDVPTTFYGAWNICMSYLIDNYPDAKIGIVVSHAFSSVNAELFRTAVRNIAKKYGVKTFDIPGDTNIPFWASDSAGASYVDAGIKTKRFAQWFYNAHPTPAGYRYISYPFEAWLRTL